MGKGYSESRAALYRLREYRRKLVKLDRVAARKRKSVAVEKFGGNHGR